MQNAFEKVISMFLVLAAVAGCWALQQPAASGPQLRSSYVLGPGDQIVIRALDAEEISEKPILIGTDGNISLPLMGRLRAGGLTVEQLEAELATRLKKYIQEPQVAVTVTEFRSQPVSVIGAVNRPGVHQLQGRKTLVEMLSLAGGLGNEAGYSIKITRRLDFGRIPLANAADDPTGRFNVAEVSVKQIMEASSPAENIQIMPHDVISVPRGRMVYVIGQVKRSGGFVLGERENVSVLQALSLAEGLGRAAAPKNGKILRINPKTASRVEIAVNLKKILAGKARDVAMEPDDILFVPGSTGKKVALRTLEAAVSVGSGVAIWRGAGY
jgi:polysaccharide export outer membrane protein